MNSPSNGSDNLPTVVPQAGDSIDQALAYYDDSTQNIMRGTRVRFDYETGNFLTQNGDVINPQMPLTVTGVAQVWVKFEADPETGAVRPIYRGVDADGLLPERHELGDGYSLQPDGTIKVDKTGWKKFMGQLQDPWTEQKLVYLVDEATMEEFTVVLKSQSSKAAWYVLLGRIKERRRQYPGALPIVQLQWQPMNTQYGTKKRPHFKVSPHWKLDPGVVEQVVEQQPSLAQDIDDELPV
jgi:hypothetical protein